MAKRRKVVRKGEWAAVGRPVDGEEREHSWILEATKHAPQVRSIRRLAARWKRGGAQSLRAQAGGGVGVHAAA